MENYPIVPGRGMVTRKATHQRLDFMRHQGFDLKLISQSEFAPHQIVNNIESYIGSISIPVGLIGPLLFNHQNQQEYVYAPAATTEGALVASINRGSKIISQCGGFYAEVIHQKMIRAPFFLFRNLSQSIQFKKWINRNFDLIKEVAQQYSNHAHLQTIESVVTGRGVHLKFVYTTGDASGQNMTTKCTWHAALWINENFEKQTHIRPVDFVIEGNGASDKKASHYSIIQGRGIHVAAECWLSEKEVKRILRISSDDFLRHYTSSMIMSQMDGMMGYNINAVNVIAAVFAATGQDLASIHESGNAFLIAEKTPDGIYFCLHLPSLVAGTIGGGTMLPRQREALALMKCNEKNSVDRFAKMIAGFALALEISTSAAILGDQFVSAHEKLGRNKPVNWITRSEINIDLLNEAINNGFPFKDYDDIKLSEQQSADNGAISGLAHKITDKLIGIFVAEAYSKNSPDRNEPNSNSRFIIKSKPTSQETIKGLQLLGSAIDKNLPTLIWKHKEITEYNQSHTKEINAYELLYEKGFTCIPEFYGKKVDEKREVYMIFQEYLDSDKMLLFNSENHTRSWNDNLIRDVIHTITDIHNAFPANDELARTIPYFKPWEGLGLYTRLPDVIRSEYIDEDWTNLLPTIKRFAEELEALHQDIHMNKCLVHNDFNPRNVAIRANGQPCIYDWELVVLHYPQRDIVEFLSFVLPEDFSEQRFIDHLQYQHQISSFQKDWQEWKKAGIYCLKEYLVTRVSFYLTGKILLEFDFAVRILKNACRMIDILENRN